MTTPHKKTINKYRGSPPNYLETYNDDNAYLISLQLVDLHEHPLRAHLVTSNLGVIQVVAMNVRMPYLSISHAHTQYISTVSIWIAHQLRGRNNIEEVKISTGRENEVCIRGDKH